MNKRRQAKRVMETCHSGRAGQFFILISVNLLCHNYVASCSGRTLCTPDDQDFLSFFFFLEGGWWTKQLMRKFWQRPFAKKILIAITPDHQELVCSCFAPNP